MEVLSVSEESTLVKDETVKSTAEGTVTAGEDAVTPTNADASNIVPFNSEEPAAMNTAEVSEEAQDPSVNIAETATPAEGAAAKVVQKASDIADKASAYTEKAADFAGKTAQKAASRIKPEPEDDFLNEDIPEKKRFHFKRDDKEFFRDKWILSRISEENLMEYLKLEQQRSELQQEAKNIKEKRILKAFEMTLGLAAIVAVIYLLRDNPSILVNILYIAGILAAFWVWKNPKDK